LTDKIALRYATFALNLQIFGISTLTNYCFFSDRNRAKCKCSTRRWGMSSHLNNNFLQQRFDQLSASHSQHLTFVYLFWRYINLYAKNLTDVQVLLNLNL